MSKTLSGLCLRLPTRLSRKDVEVKQTLLDIKRTTNVTTKAIAERAQLPVADVFVVETGGFSSKETAQRVVTAFNQLSGMQVMLEDIRIYNQAKGHDRSYRHLRE
jgi:hypothetical protein